MIDIDNFALYAWYVFWAAVGTTLFFILKKKWWLGTIVGLIFATVALTVLALLFAG